jgi:WD40 repeat protein
MNLSLLDPFRKSTPDRVESTLPCPVRDPSDPEAVGAIGASALSFNRRGSYLAVGYDNGSIGVWDSLSRSVVTIVDEVHPGEIVSVCWARRGRHIVSAGADGTVSRISLASSPRRVESFDISALCAAAGSWPSGDAAGESTDMAGVDPSRSNASNFLPSSPSAPASLMKLMLHPHNQSVLLAVFSDGVLALVHLPPLVPPSSSNHPVGTPNPPQSQPTLRVLLRPTSIPDAESTLPSSGPGRYRRTTRSANFTTDASFDKSGALVFATTQLGEVNIFDVASGDLSSSFKVFGSTSAIKSIKFSRDGRKFILNSADSTLRLFSSDSRDGRARISYQDTINKVKWFACDFSHDGEHIVGVSTGRHATSLFIWSTDK